MKSENTGITEYAPESIDLARTDVDAKSEVMHKQGYVSAKNFGIIRKTYRFVKMYMEQNTNLPYHNFGHALDFVHSALRLAKMEGIADDERLELILGGLTHDLYIDLKGKQNEEISARLCEMVLPSYGVPIDVTIRVADLVRATDMRVAPKSLLEKIMRDADTDNVGRPDCISKGGLVMEELGVPAGSKRYEAQIKFMNFHEWHTESAKKLRGEGKRKNLLVLEALFDAARYEESMPSSERTSYQCF